MNSTIPQQHAGEDSREIERREKTTQLERDLGIDSVGKANLFALAVLHHFTFRGKQRRH